MVTRENLVVLGLGVTGLAVARHLRVVEGQRLVVGASDDERALFSALLGRRLISGTATYELELPGSTDRHRATVVIDKEGRFAQKIERESEAGWTVRSQYVEGARQALVCQPSDGSADLECAPTEPRLGPLDALAAVVGGTVDFDVDPASICFAITTEGVPGLAAGEFCTSQSGRLASRTDANGLALDLSSESDIIDPALFDAVLEEY